MKTCALFVGHGSRKPGVDRKTEALIQRYYDSYGRKTPLYFGFLEISQPHIELVMEELAQEYQRIILIPLAFFAAGHVKNDLPLAVAQFQKKFPKVEWLATRPLGVEPIWVQAVQDMLSQLDLKSEDHDLLLVIGRGSSDADANSEFYKISRLIAEGLGIRQLVPCFVSITEPSLDDALRILARIRPKKVLMLPFFLFTGVLLDRIYQKVGEFAKQQAGIQVTSLPALGDSPQMLELLRSRVENPLDGETPLPCLTCQYRVPMGELQDQVGGLRSLLWSVRHTFTHKQAVPHTHAHATFKKHVLVCTNTDCVDRGALGVVRTLREELKRAGCFRQHRITRTSCMGRCGEGPTVAVYPDGIWYRNLTSEGAKEIVHKHLMNDQLVDTFVDSIMS